MINRCLNKHRPNIKCGHFIWQWLWLILDTFSLQGSSMRVELWLAKILKTGCQWCVWFRLRFRETLLPPLVQRSPWHRGQSGAGPRRRGVMVVTVSRSLNCSTVQYSSVQYSTVQLWWWWQLADPWTAMQCCRLCNTVILLCVVRLGMSIHVTCYKLHVTCYTLHVSQCRFIVLVMAAFISTVAVSVKEELRWTDFCTVAALHCVLCVLNEI